MADEPDTVVYRVMPNNGSGWYWELIADREVIARGLAETYSKARIDVLSAGMAMNRDRSALLISNAS